jgi:hypothetical protein
MENIQPLCAEYFLKLYRKIIPHEDKSPIEKPFSPFSYFYVYSPVGTRTGDAE